jgi:glycosyltransferase involved in cell wall biosynthesis
MEKRITKLTMKIAQIAPLWERVPPPAYGGTELVVSLITEELVRRGHQVTLFATGDSITSAHLEAGSPTTLRSQGATPDQCKAYDVYRLSHLKTDDFDIIHSHIDTHALTYGNTLQIPIIHTIHGVIPKHSEKLFSDYRDQAYVSISEAQRRKDLGLNYVATVYNGIDIRTYQFHAHSSNPPYLAFLGRISPEKGPHLAIQLAKKTGWHLKLAGKIDPVDREYYEQEIKPFVDDRQIEYLGEANHAQKSEIMGQAFATLCLITWEEPFGLVMPESMACGTPVIAMSKGAAPELILHGKTGFLCHTLEDCITALDRIPTIDRQDCRTHVEQNFSATRMVNGYESVYQQLLGSNVKGVSEILHRS